MISDPIEFELFKNALFGVADEMALTVFRTTYSGVLKDNMDYSTAMFDGQGVLVAQGLTLPGHLGSMPTAIAAVKEAFAGDIAPGDVFVFNDPFRGGMHLPDVFVFKPIFLYTSSSVRSHLKALPHDGGGLGGGDRADRTEFAATSPPPHPSPSKGEGKVADEDRGSGAPIAWAGTVCHHTDVGGRVPGSNASDS